MPSEDSAVTLCLPPEPEDLRASYREVDPAVRSVSIRQASDIVTPIYHGWREQLRPSGMSWQRFVAAGSRNADLWSRWLDGAATWDQAVEGLVEQMNQGDSDGTHFRSGS